MMKGMAQQHASQVQPSTRNLFFCERGTPVGQRFRSFGVREVWGSGGFGFGRFGVREVWGSRGGPSRFGVDG